MIGLVIVTHGQLAKEFLSAMEHVVGPQPAVVAICIGPDDDMDRRRRDILKACSPTCSAGRRPTSPSR
jgi:PTS system mannose-specific IIA component